MFGIEPFIAASGILFWVIVCISSFCIIASIETDSPYWATGIAILTLLFVQIATPYNPFTWITSNPVEAFSWVVAYFLGGLTWAFVKWIFYMHRIKDIVKNLRKKYDTQTSTLKFNEWVILERNYPEGNYPPLVSENKAQITFWATFWPWSAFWTLLNDPIRMIWNWCYKVFGTGLQNITNNVFKDI